MIGSPTRASVESILAKGLADLGPGVASEVCDVPHANLRGPEAFVMGGTDGWGHQPSPPWHAATLARPRCLLRQARGPAAAELDFDERLCRILDHEIAMRANARVARRTREAGFGMRASPEGFELTEG
jgi:hypothetical protein